MAIVEAKKLGAETNSKGVNFHAAAARNPEVTELVKKNDNRENKQKGQQIAEKRTTPRAQNRENIHHHIPSELLPP